MKVHGIHHVTAVSAQIALNLEFYTRTMGMRLIKKSINQDDVSAYHLFYSDGVGSPGTDLTFFDWNWMGRRTPGYGTISETTLRVRGAELLDWWDRRLRDQGLETRRLEDATGRDALAFEDFEGQRLELVDDSGLPGSAQPWSSGSVPEAHAYRGILAVTLNVRAQEPTTRVLTELLGFSPVDGASTDSALFEIRGADSIGQVRLEPAAPGRGAVGAGGVHHVAFRVEDDAALLSFQERIEAAGLPTSGYVDRYYFHSLYFREPNGILFELATDGPGMTIDEPLETAGSHLSIPPFLESGRGAIEAGLKPL